MAVSSYQLRCHVETGPKYWGIGIWVPWKPAHEPLIYWFWKRIFEPWGDR